MNEKKSVRRSARHTTWLMLITLWCLLSTGCTANQWQLYKVGEQERWASNPCSEKIRKSWQLYSRGELKVARQLAETLLDDSEASVQAIELVAVIQTKQGDGDMARCLLEDGIEKHPHSSSLRTAYIWHLTVEGEYAEAERQSLRAAKECNDLELWEWHTAVTKEIEKRKYLLLVVIGFFAVALMVGVAVFLLRVYCEMRENEARHPKKGSFVKRYWDQVVNMAGGLPKWTVAFCCLSVVLPLIVGWWGEFNWSAVYFGLAAVVLRKVILFLNPEEAQLIDL